MGYHLKVIGAEASSMSAATAAVNTALATELVSFGQQNVSCNNNATSHSQDGTIYINVVLVQEAG